MDPTFELDWPKKYDLFFNHFVRKAKTEEEFLVAQEHSADEADRTRVFDFTGHVRQF